MERAQADNPSEALASRADHSAAEQDPSVAPVTGGDQHGAKHHGVVSAVRVIAGVTLISRFGGLFRDAATARVFGDSLVATAFNFAFMMPNVFRRLFGEGALTASFIPEYAQLEQDDRARAGRFASFTVALTAVITLALTLLIEAALGVALWTGTHDHGRLLMLHLTMLMLPFMPFVCVAAVLAGMLQTHGRFGIAAAGPLILNTALIVGSLVAYLAVKMTPEETAYLVSGAVVASGAALVATLFFALRGRVRWSARMTGVREPASRMLRRFIPAVVGLAGLQLASILDGVIATYGTLIGPTFFGFAWPLDAKTGGILGYTQRLYQFPLGVFGIAVATAVFPALSRAAKDKPLFTEMLRRGLRLSLFISLPASVGLALVGEDMTRVLLRGGNFSEEGVRRGAAILIGYAVSVWAYSANQILTRAFFAVGDTWTPVKISLQCIGLNVLGNLTLIWVPGVGETAFGWSTAASAMVQFWMLVRAARPLMTDGRLLDAAAMRGGGMTLDFTLAMGLGVVLLQEMLPTGATFGWTIARLVLCCAVGIGVYGLLARRFRIPELTWLLSKQV